MGAYNYNGHAGGGNQVLVLRNVIPEAIAATDWHGLSQAMGMAGMPPGASTELSNHVDNGGWHYRNKTSAPYTNRLRALCQGPHRSNGMPALKRLHQRFNGWSPAGASPACDLWGPAGGEDSRMQYGDNCTRILKARDPHDVWMNWTECAEG